MLNYIKNFRNDEDGAVTVDWVVLCAAVVGLGVAVMSTVGTSVNTAGGTVGTDITGNADPTFE
jgi:Flp pilus assembly pilin Flp